MVIIHTSKKKKRKKDEYKIKYVEKENSIKLLYSPNSGPQTRGIISRMALQDGSSKQS